MSDAVKGSIRPTMRPRAVATKMSAPTAIVASEIHSAGSNPCHSSRCAGYSGGSMPGLAAGARAAYGANAVSSSGAHRPATTVSPDSSTGAPRKPIGGSGHGVGATRSPAASRLVQYAPQMNRMP